MVAAYFDDSADAARRRVVVAGSVANSSVWSDFEQRWRSILRSVNRESEFHALKNDNVQVLLNRLLAYMMRDFHISTICVTVDRGEYETASTRLQRGRIGNADGLAGIECISRISESPLSGQDGIGYYVDQGGQGFAKMIQFLTTAYQDEEFKADLKLADFGPANRKIHLPLHPADLVAHEVATNQLASESLRILAGYVTVIDLSLDDIKVRLSLVNPLWDADRHAKEREKTAKRIKQKR